MFARLVLVAALALPSLSAAQAQSAKPKTRLAVYVGGFDRDASQCGLSESSIKAPAVLALRQNGIEVSVADVTPYLRVQVNVFKTTAGACVYSVEVSVSGAVESGFTNWAVQPIHKFGSLVLCQKGTLGTKSMPIVDEFTQTISRLTGQCLADLTY